MLSYTADQLCSFNRSDRPPQRHVRKAIFSLQLWWPKRLHTSRLAYGGGTRRHSREGHSSPSHDELTVGVFNAQSVTQKSTAISETVIDRQLDVLALTETWHHASDDLPLRRCAPPGYAIVDASRQSTDRGGGVSLLFSKRFSAKRLTFVVQPTTFEVLGCMLRSESVSAVYIVIYRPGSKAVTELFFDEFICLLETVGCRYIPLSDRYLQ
jgi:hypothetical protein